MNADRALLNALFRLEVLNGRTLAWNRRRSMERPAFEVEHLSTAAGMSLSRGQETIAEHGWLTVRGSGGTTSASWSARLQLAERQVESWTVHIDGPPSELAFMLSGVKLVREAIANGSIQGDLVPIVLLNSAIERAQPGLQPMGNRLALWCWAESYLQITEADRTPLALDGA